MSVSLAEYTEWLDDRKLIWPVVPAPKPITATPHVKLLPEVRAVTFDIYGTLLRIADGRFLYEAPEELRTQVAMDKTIREFNMWNSMYRKPGAPWQSMLPQYRDILSRQQMAGGGRAGDYPQVDMSDVWYRLLERLLQKNYVWDTEFYGDLDDLAECVAWFFHANLQATEARSGALDVLRDIAACEMPVGLISDAQPFTFLQLLRGLSTLGTLPSVTEIFRTELIVLSFRLQLRKPSRTLIERAAAQVRSVGLLPSQVLHVGTRMTDDLAPMKKAGFRTALLAAEKDGVDASPELMKDSRVRPDLLLTKLSQLRRVIGL